MVFASIFTNEEGVRLVFMGTNKEAAIETARRRGKRYQRKIEQMVFTYTTVMKDDVFGTGTLAGVCQRDDAGLMVVLPSFAR